MEFAEHPTMESENDSKSQKQEMIFPYQAYSPVKSEKQPALVPELKEYH